MEIAAPPNASRRVNSGLSGEVHLPRRGMSVTEIGIMDTRAAALSGRSGKVGSEIDVLLVAAGGSEPVTKFNRRSFVSPLLSLNCAALTPRQHAGYRARCLRAIVEEWCWPAQAAHPPAEYL